MKPAAAAPVDLRQLRREVVAEEIERVAMEAFAGRGLSDVTVDDIAQAVGISPRTFFRYFPSKGDLVRAHQRRVLDRLVRALAARPANEGPVTALREAFLVTARMRPEDTAWIVLVGRVLASAREGGVLDVGFEADRNRELVGLVAGRARHDGNDLRPSLLVATMMAAAQTAFRAWLTDGGQIGLDRIMAEAFDLVEAGLADMDHRPAPRSRSARQAVVR